MLAVMDIGTNSCRLLLAEQVGAERKIKKVQAFLRTTRIGEGMCGEDRIISPAAIDRTLAALREYAAKIEEHHAQEVILVATQAVREAKNRDALVKEIKNELNWELVILSGDSEARLSYLGAVAGLALKAPALVVDIGGGSTEFAWSENNGGVQGVSVAIGALRLLEAPKTDAEVIERLQKALANVGNAERAEKTRGIQAVAGSLLVGVGGTCTTAAAVSLNMAEYDSDKVQGHHLTIETIHRQYNMLKDLEPHERLSIAGVPKGREDIIVPGLQILIAVMIALGEKVITISDQDLLYGLILELAPIRLSPFPSL